MTIRFLVLVVVAEATLAVVLLAAHLWYAALGRRRRIVQQRCERARALLIDAVVTDRVGDETIAQLTALRPADTDAVVCDVAIGVHSKDDPVFGELADAVGLVGRVETDLRSRRWWVRRAAIRRALVLGLSSMPIAPLLGDDDPRVRATTVRWVAELGSEDDRAGSIVALLDDPDARVRYAAQSALCDLGSGAQRALLAELGDPVRSRLVPTLQVAAALRDPVVASAVEPHVDDEDHSVRVEAIRAIGLVLGPDDATRLAAWLVDDDPKIRSAATDAAVLAGLPDTAGALARNLASDEGATREAAIEALGRLGPTGDLLLRRAARKVGAAHG